MGVSSFVSGGHTEQRSSARRSVRGWAWADRDQGSSFSWMRARGSHTGHASAREHKVCSPRAANHSKRRQSASPPPWPFPRSLTALGRSGLWRELRPSLTLVPGRTVGQAGCRRPGAYVRSHLPAEERGDCPGHRSEGRRRLIEEPSATHRRASLLRTTNVGGVVRVRGTAGPRAATGPPDLLPSSAPVFRGDSTCRRTREHQPTSEAACHPGRSRRAV